MKIMHLELTSDIFSHAGYFHSNLGKAADKRDQPFENGITFEFIIVAGLFTFPACPSSVRWPWKFL